MGLQLIRQTQGQLPSRVASRNGAGQDRSISLLICFLIKAREEGRKKSTGEMKALVISAFVFEGPNQKLNFSLLHN